MEQIFGASERASLLKWADYYIGLGWPVIPVSGDKKPLIPWKQYQTRLTTIEEVEGWLEHYPNMTGLGVPTGAFSGIVVIDIEAEGDASPYDDIDTLRARTGGGGVHLLFKHPGFNVPNSVKELAPFTDCRGDGGFIVVAPSISSKGSYSWIKSPEQASLAELPKHVLDFLRGGEQPTDWERFVETDVLKGGRNEAAASYIGYLLLKHPQEQWESETWKKLQEWNSERCKPSLPLQELRSTFDSIRAREEARPKSLETGGTARPSASTRLVDSIVNNPDITLFRDRYSEAFARLPVNGHKEIWPCDSREFRRYVGRAFYVASGGKETLSKEAISAAINTIEGHAIYDGEQHDLHVRVAKTSDGAVWYDLGDDLWRAVKITKGGWEIVDEPPILFRRFNHVDVQLEPERGGKLDDVLRFVNITDEDQKILFQVYLVATMIPGFHHPMPFVYGPQGSAKSTLSKILRKLIDPSKLEVVSLTRHEKDLVLQLDHHYLLFFDNVSSISDWIADLLCRAITSTGVADRTLYTNSDETIRFLHSSIGMNGISLSIDRPDLLERCILFELERVDKDTRRDEDELYAEFEAMRPKLVGAIFDAAADALAILPSVVISEKPRMADFARHGYAVAEALGIGGEKFLAAYLRNIGSQSRAAVDNDLVATLIAELVEEHDPWAGTYTQLRTKLSDMLITKKQPDLFKALPADPSALSRAVGRIKPPLADEGILIEKDPKSRRAVIIRKVPTKADEADGAVGSESCP